MGRLCYIVFALLNAMSLVGSIYLVAMCLYLHVLGPTECQKVLIYKYLVLGIVIFFLSLLGLIGSFSRTNALLMIYLIVLTIWILGLIIFATVVIVVSNKNGDQPDWLQRKFVNGKTWDSIKSCMIEAKLCSALNLPIINGTTTEEDVHSRGDLDHVPTGCCLPPKDCGYEFKNLTFWAVPETGLRRRDGDCSDWNNWEETLCYNCDSCKLSILAQYKQIGAFLAVFSTLETLLVIILFYFSGCCTRRNNKCRK
ncbi:hypothetical protein CRYUN_Cryun15aG0090600 [Craigia yunnanensis]